MPSNFVLCAILCSDSVPTLRDTPSDLMFIAGATQTPNFHKLSAVSLAAAVMSISYSTIAIGVSAHAGRQPDAEYNLDGFTKAEGIFGIFNALGTIAFAYGGHIQLELLIFMFALHPRSKCTLTCHCKSDTLCCFD